MIEIPEAYVLSEQIEQTLVGKTIVRATANAHPHSFAMYTGDPAAYGAMLAGKRVTGSNPGTGYTCGGNTEIVCEDMLLVISTPIKYHAPDAKPPAKHQLLLEFDDGARMSCTVRMWGSMLCGPVTESNELWSFEYNPLPDPLTQGFNEAYFDGLFGSVKPSMSAKAFLATEQRIPGLGNGVLQDILFNAGIHPKRKLETMGDADREKLFNSVKSTLAQMRAEGGRDTEKDLHNRAGGYKTILSKNTLQQPCPVCAGELTRQAYLGGNIYFCAVCQPL